MREKERARERARGAGAKGLRWSLACNRSSRCYGDRACFFIFFIIMMISIAVCVACNVGEQRVDGFVASIQRVEGSLVCWLHAACDGGGDDDGSRSCKITALSASLGRTLSLIKPSNGWWNYNVEFVRDRPLHHLHVEQSGIFFSPRFFQFISQRFGWYFIKEILFSFALQEKKIRVVSANGVVV